jgi:intracellular sulfur oxidation DsrE/DsrF family protein
MKKDDLISEEQLNAFADGELDTEEESRIFELAENSPELDARLCQQRKLKEMVQHAFRNVPQGNKRSLQRRSNKRRLGLTIAAMLLLATGATVGWLTAQTMGTGQPGMPFAVAAQQEQSEAWLLHVSSSDPERMKLALRRADELVNGPGATEARRVEIVANEGGLDLLRSDTTPFSQEIRELARNDVLFFACSRAIERLEREGVDVQLLPEANTEYSALDRVVLRLQQGWEYVKI